MVSPPSPSQTYLGYLRLPPPVCRASSTDRLLPSPADSDSAPVVLDGAAAPPYQDDADAVPAAHPLVQLMKAAE